MSERYGECRRCKGNGYIWVDHKWLKGAADSKECPRCYGTGFESSAEAYEEREKD